jgi:hypothetical protein
MESKTSKLKLRKVTDAEKIATIIKRGKYRPELPFFTRDQDGGLWVEVQ